ncbi:hypothetical protein ABPG77_003075 [Micractinium sp. CCAP 211/92]
MIDEPVGPIDVFGGEPGPAEAGCDLLRQTSLSVFREHHPQLANKLEGIFALAQAWCLPESDSDFEMLEKRLEALTPDESILVEAATRSTNKSLQRLVNKLGTKPEDIHAALCNQTVDLVFTAHPTQATRQSMLKKYGEIRHAMGRLHNTRLSNYERLETLDEIRSQVQGAWRTDEIRRRKPTPQDESREGLTYFHETIYSGLPVFLRRIDTALKNIGCCR